VKAAVLKFERLEYPGYVQLLQHGLGSWMERLYKATPQYQLLFALHSIFSASFSKRITIRVMEVKNYITASHGCAPEPLGIVYTIDEKGRKGQIPRL
jgi:hypothetical protein